MVLGNRGQTILYGLMMAITIIVIALAFAYPVWQSASQARNSTTDSGGIGLDCSNSSISDYTKAACITTDLTPFYFVGILIFIGGSVLFAKIVFS